MRRDEELEKRIQEKVSLRKEDILNLDIVLEDGRRISHVGMKEREVIIYGCRTILGCVGGGRSDEIRPLFPPIQFVASKPSR